MHAAPPTPATRTRRGSSVVAALSMVALAVPAALLGAAPAGAVTGDTTPAPGTVRPADGAVAGGVPVTPSGDPATPTRWIRVTAPPVTSTLPVTISWESGPDVLDEAVFFTVEVNGVLVRTVGAGTSSVAYRVENGSYTVIVTAYDADGAPVIGSESVPFEVAGLAPFQVFGDVPPEHPFFSEILWMREAQITTGLPDGTFHPTESVSREAVAAFLYRFSGAELAGYTPPATARFSDVPVGHPFYTAVSWLAETGITSGYPDGRFGASDPITREAMAAFLFRFAGAAEGYTPPEKPLFTDVERTHPFYTQISWLAEAEIARGRADGTFGASDRISREAVAAFLCRFAGGPV